MTVSVIAVLSLRDTGGAGWVNPVEVYLVELLG